MNTFLIAAYYGGNRESVRFKTEKTLEQVKAGIVAKSYNSHGFYIFDNENEEDKCVAGINLSKADCVFIKQEN